MIKAIVFDLDGTIANTVSAIRNGINLTMDKLGYPRSTDEDVLAHINFGARRLIRLSLPQKLQENEEEVDRALSLYDKMYATTYLETDKTYDGIPAAFETLAREGYSLGVLSNKQDPFVVELCRQLLPAGTYKVARGQRVGAPTKPDPTVPWEIAGLLGATPAECAMVGDTPVDVQTAKNAGFLSVAVSWGYRPRTDLEAACPDFIVDRVNDLVPLFDKLREADK